MSACSLINFAINPQPLTGEIDSVNKSDRINRYLKYHKLYLEESLVET